MSGEGLESMTQADAAKLVVVIDSEMSAMLMSLILFDIMESCYEG